MTAETIEAVRLADLLTQTAQDRPDRVRRAGAQMAALELALTRPDAAEAIAEPTDVVLRAIASAPDLTGAQSLMSAVHLASYREYENLLSGWSSLQADAPEVLGRLEARVSEVDLGDRGVFLRLKAGPLDSPAMARALCAQLDAAGHWCAPADYTGDLLETHAD